MVVFVASTPLQILENDDKMPRQNLVVERKTILSHDFMKKRKLGPVPTVPNAATQKNNALALTTALPILPFGESEGCAKKHSGCLSMDKAYKLFVELGYLDDVKGLFLCFKMAGERRFYHALI